MPEPINSRSWLSRLVRWTSTAYYLYWGAGVLGAAAAMGAAIVEQRPVVRNFLYYIALILALVFLGALRSFIGRRNARRRKLLNPTLKVERRTLECSISPEAFSEHDQTTYLATAESRWLTFAYVLTGVGTLQLQLRSPGELRGPLIRNEVLYYQVVFLKAIKKGERYHLDFQANVNDPGRTMKPFYGCTANNIARPSKLTMTLHFPSQRPKNVFYTLSALDVEALNEPLIELFPTLTGSVQVEVDDVQAGHEYLISWSW